MKMAESSDTRYTVSKLNNSNYQIWKFKVKMLLIREEIWTVVQGDKPDPVPDDWQRKDEKAQCTISLTVEDITSATAQVRRTCGRYTKDLISVAKCICERNFIRRPEHAGVH